jgi:hypothetical protein
LGVVTRLGIGAYLLAWTFLLLAAFTVSQCNRSIHLAGPELHIGAPAATPTVTPTPQPNLRSK